MHKLVDEYNNPYHRSAGKKTIDADYFPLTKEIESSHKAPQFKLQVRITKHNNIFSKGYTNNWSREITVIDSVLESNT